MNAIKPTKTVIDSGLPYLLCPPTNYSIYVSFDSFSGLSIEDNGEPVTKKLFFMHIPKNMGTFMFQHYFADDSDYLHKYYGNYLSMDEYYNRQQNLPVQWENNNPFGYSISIDHLLLSELINYKIVDSSNVDQFLFIMIIREPIERFLSLCNHWNGEPVKMITLIKQINQIKILSFSLYQHLMPQSNYVENIQLYTTQYRLFSMNRKEEIRLFMKDYFPNNNVDFNTPVGSSVKKFNREQLTETDIDFLKDYYHSDFLLYEQIKN
jgi:hypothetical protein